MDRCIALDRLYTLSLISFLALYKRKFPNTQPHLVVKWKPLKLQIKAEHRRANPQTNAPIVEPDVREHEAADHFELVQIPDGTVDAVGDLTDSDPTEHVGRYR